MKRVAPYVVAWLLLTLSGTTQASVAYHPVSNEPTWSPDGTRSAFRVDVDALIVTRQAAPPFSPPALPLVP